jgi:DNA-binding NarL/FixJ family response regulator
VTPKPINILLVVDHKLSAEGLSLLIQSFDRSITLYHAPEIDEVLHVLTGATKIDIVLLDIQAPFSVWVNTIKQIKKLEPKPSLLALVHFDDKPLISYLISLGTNGLLLRGSKPSDLKEAIFGLLERGYFYDASVLDIIHEDIVKDHNHAGPEISPREFQVMVLLAEGNTSKDIAMILKLSTRTIESYRKSLMKRTGCRNVAEVVRLAYRTGVVQ